MKEFVQTIFGVVVCLAPVFWMTYVDFKIQDEHFKILQKLRNRD